MSLVKDIDLITDWINNEVCKKIELKVPNDEVHDTRYTPKYANPTAYSVFLPPIDMLPSGLETSHPSVCVEIIEGEEHISKRFRLLNIRFCLSVWNPGIHGRELFKPEKDLNKFIQTNYKKWSGSDAEAYYKRNYDGWKDIWNFTDRTLKTLSEAENIGGLMIDKEQPVKYGMFTEEGAVIDYYPYFHMWISCTLRKPLAIKSNFL